MYDITKLLTIVAVLMAVSCGTVGRAADEPAAETKEQYEARLQWWREARFGLFIHWGSVSLKGTEIGWSRGANGGARAARGKFPSRSTTTSTRNSTRSSSTPSSGSPSPSRPA